MKKIYICEDEGPIAKLISLKLKNEGYQTTTFSNGESLKDSLNVEKTDLVLPDLILLDVMMPGLDGITILKMMKKDEKLKDIKVIMLTALSRESDIVSCLDMGADDYITKPFSPSELSSRIKKLLK
ncbi:MAG TPA: response regulator [Candidatus Wallbacteria bacterium]|nr:response regulator [Candidatus Wallbacteria bacterium]